MELGASIPAAKPVCDFLLVINTNGHASPYRFALSQHINTNFEHCVFEPPFGGGLGTTYDVRLRLIGKRVWTSY